MSPREVRSDRLWAHLARLRELLDDLEPLRDVTAATLRHDKTTRYVVERIITAVVDGAVAINSHLAAALLERASESYGSSFQAVARAGVIPADLATRLAPSAGLRNALVHAYLDIDLDRVAGSVPLTLSGYREYVTAVAAFLSERPDAH